jgi:hypothetical protein
MTPDIETVIRAVASVGITAPTEKVVARLVEQGYDIPDNFERGLYEHARRRMLEPPAAMFDELPDVTLRQRTRLHLVATLPPVDPATFERWRFVDQC